MILVKFTNSLVRSRPLKEIGAEQARASMAWVPEESNFILLQLLIDLQTVKAYLTKMPGEALITSTYVAFLHPLELIDSQRFL